MAEPQLVKIDRGRALVDGLVLPDPPPTRVYISGRLYRLSASPTVALPPLINTVKTILNWSGPASRIAKNIFYAKTGGSFITSDTTELLALANQIKGLFTSSTLDGQISSSWKLDSVTCKDNGGTTASATTTSASVPGTGSSTALPPQVSIAISWQVPESYRGGKPRWYLPGIPNTAVFPAGSSTVEPVYAGQLEAKATTFMNTFNALIPVSGASVTLGTVSYYTGHSVRPTPLFRTFINARVHERLDSQRRRSGSESLFPTVP